MQIGTGARSSQSVGFGCGGDTTIIGMADTTREEGEPEGTTVTLPPIINLNRSQGGVHEFEEWAVSEYELSSLVCTLAKSVCN